RSRAPSGVPLCLLLLSLPCSCAHRDLHSFPTRRSSDLGVQVGKRGDRHPSRLRAVCLVHSAGPARDHDVAASVASGSGRSLTSRDRKSTRLNSSHVSISYAVFCLKKKKTSRYIHTELPH